MAINDDPVMAIEPTNADVMQSAQSVKQEKMKFSAKRYDRFKFIKDFIDKKNHAQKINVSLQNASQSLKKFV